MNRSSHVEPALPALNRRAELALDASSTWLPTRIEGLAAGVVEVAAPMEATVFLAPEVGAKVTLRWSTGKGLGEVEGVVLGAGAGSVPTWCLEVVEGAVRLVQRRAAFRVPVLLPASVTWVVPGNCRRRRATVVELSETGARMTVAAEDAAFTGPMTVSLAAGPACFDVDAELVRTVELADDRVELAVWFCEASVGTAGAIRAFLFAEQRRRRAAEVDR